MEMRVNGSVVKSERRKRAWSQEHLAAVSGLGRRTIQRIETGGTASYESIHALAAAFSLQVQDLAVEPPESGSSRSVGRNIFLLASMMFSGLIAAVLTTNSWAAMVMLDVGISQNSKLISEGHLLVSEGKEAEMRVDNVIRLVITPTVQDDGKVLLEAQIFEVVNGHFLLLGEPSLITANNKTAEIRTNGRSGELFSVVVTPHADQ